ncbi:uroporphyrinogen decarboxylase family protein [Eubacterium sp. 1001713B170207_170306_E7]|uniref:uroporphyrinogen decarboxylase family protein n=1 Tax=Eubacterium sp. 1001713B170207_170306_E7 TaxID=2787097 RepID=UPI00189B99F8|nr:uroporphyrinogen decarboxylase family protein [Eubacterium sp. 1001713B170207_170306_E7]
MENVKNLQEERKQLFNDFYNNRIPKRMPIQIQVPHTIMGAVGKISPFEYQYHFDLLKDAADKICLSLNSDTCPIIGVGHNARVPAYYQFLASNNFQMGANGQMQHPEVSGMTADEYGALIADPYAFMLETAIPRHYGSLALDKPVERTLALKAAQSAVQRLTGQMGQTLRHLTEKYGYYPGAPLGSGGFVAAPFDFLSDQLRGFNGISMDLRRHKSQIKEACEALLPLMYRFALPPNPHPEGFIGNPLHMPPFMRPKDVEELWFPTYKTLLEQLAARGARVRAFCEGDWTRYLDLLRELPAGTMLAFEYGDPKLFKEKLGDKFILVGFYPLALLKTGTPQQCIDKAKELLDIMLPGGGYLFNFDKAPMAAEDMNLDNLYALTDFLRDYAVYDNAGDSYGMALNTENYRPDPSVEAFDSKYAFDWDRHQRIYPLTPEDARPFLETTYNQSFRDNILLLV